MNQSVKVKICGLRRPEDIMYVNTLRPDYVGFIVNFPKSFRSLTFEEAEELRRGLAEGISPVGVFVDEDLRRVADLLNRDVIDVAQLHGNEDNSYIEKLKALTHKTVWKAFQIKSSEDTAKANECSADFVLLDAGQGSGKVFDWELLRLMNRPYGLAGGLDINNLQQALETQAVLLDVSGGVETDRKKDINKISEFLQGVRA